MKGGRQKDYSGRFMGEVVSVDDPEKRCRVKVNVYDMTDGVPVASLPWAMQSLPLGTRPGSGGMVPMQVGDKVWVEYIGKDSRRPLVTGAAMEAPKGKAATDPNVCQGEGSYAHRRTGSQPPAEEAPYYQDTVWQQNGVLIQLCRSGTFRLTQMGSGSAVEVTKDGHMVLHCEGSMFVSVRGDTLEEHTGNVTRRISGNLVEEISGTMTRTSQGDAFYGSSGASLGLSAATQGWMTGNGGLALTGNSTLKGTLDATGSIRSDGDIFAAGASDNHHSH